MSLRVLIVEDEMKVQRFLRQALEQAGLQVETLDSLDDLEAHLEHSPFDILLLDRLVKGRDSLALVGQLKRKFTSTRILILSALGELEDRVGGLELGADDYLPKPFHVTELLARIKSLGRRSNPEENSQRINYLDLEIQLDTQEVKRQGRVIPCTAKEFKLLTLLAKTPKRIFTKAELLDRIWGMNSDPGSNVVEVTVNRLRTKVDDGDVTPLIHTRRGSGYWFGETSGDQI